jgi:hypothetical protein
LPGGLLGGALDDLASFSSTAQRLRAFQVSVNSSLTQSDVNHLLDVVDRAQRRGTYNFEGEGSLQGLLQLLQSSDEGLVNAYRQFQFHQVEGSFLEELADLVACQRHAAQHLQAAYPKGA